MPVPSFPRSAALLLPLALLCGCASHQQYRDRYSVCSNATAELSADCARHAIQRLPLQQGGGYLLGFVEFDDQGHLWDRRQMMELVDLLNAESASRDLLLVVFVHGWKHSAAPGDGNIETFRKVLARLGADEAELGRAAGRPPRQVAGVYLGWRGGSVPVPVLENLTFWDRKNTAEKVGSGDMIEVLARLEQIKRDKASFTPDSSTRLVVVGHSFGGLVVHAALGQTLSGRFVRTAGLPRPRDDGKAERDAVRDGLSTNVEGFGDLVVLINPAFEAQRFASLSDMSTERGSYFTAQLPVVAVLTSEADYATRYAFPAGRALSTLFEQTRDSTRRNATTAQLESIAESEANVQAVGHFEPYRTHWLRPRPGVARSAVAQQRSDQDMGVALAAARGWQDDAPGSRIAFSDVVLERSATSAGRNPYLVVRVDGDLIQDHNDIDDERVVQFLKELVLISTVPQREKELLYRSFGLPPGRP
ncbi:MAG: hypothetical protein RJA36_2614 [Pseudomonadota bacterium]|jgi:hypothetical protein